MEICEWASPSVPTIAFGGNPFDSQLDVQLVACGCPNVIDIAMGH